MYKTTLVVLLFVALPPVAFADDACPPATDSSLVNFGSQVYLTPDAHVYQESNVLPGLQRNGGTCTDHNGVDLIWNADDIVI